MKLLYLILLIAVFNTVEGQRCATDDYLTALPGSNLRTFDAYNNPPDNRDTITNEVIVVPVVVHILYNNGAQNIPDGQVMAQIDALNRDYRRLNADTVNTPVPFKRLGADTRIVFCLAGVDPEGYKTTGIERKFTNESVFLADDQMKYSSKGGADAWDATKYLNIWVCNLFGRTLGYATMPGGNPKVDGIVIQYGVFGYETGVRAPYNKGRTLTHEMGHWLGLKHIWGDAENIGCGSDDIDDTPPQTGSNTGCNSFPKLSSCSADSNGDMFMNFMDFSDDGCMNLFTWGQAVRMRSQFTRGGARNSLLGSNLCDGSGAQEAPVPADKELSLRVYPNPVVDQLIIETGVSENVPGKMLSVFNIQGKLLLKKTLQNKTETIFLSGYPDGLYLVYISSGNSKKSFRVLKQSGGKKN